MQVFLLIDTSFEGHNREEHIEDFMTWCQGLGISCDSVSIEAFDGAELGLKATKEIKVSTKQEVTLLSIHTKKKNSTDSIDLWH